MAPPQSLSTVLLCLLSPSMHLSSQPPSLSLSPFPRSLLLPAQCPVKVRFSHRRWSQRELRSRPRLWAEMTSKLWIRSYGPSLKTRALLRPPHQWMPIRTLAPLLLLLGLLPLRQALLWYHHLTLLSTQGCKELQVPRPPQDKVSPQQDTHRHLHLSRGHRLVVHPAARNKCKQLTYCHEIILINSSVPQTLPSGFDQAATPPSDLTPPIPGPHQVSCTTSLPYNMHNYFSFMCTLACTI